MKKLASAFVRVILPVITVGPALADGNTSRKVSMDYRHEYRTRDMTHYDKLTLSTQLPANYFFAAETKFKTGGKNVKNKYYNDTVLNAVEMTLGKKIIIGNWTVSPIIQPEFNSTRTEWKFGVSPWYKINNRWSVGVVSSGTD